MSEARWLVRKADVAPTRAVRPTEGWVFAGSLVAFALGFRMGDPIPRAFCGAVGFFILVATVVAALARRGNRSHDEHDALRAEFPGEHGRLVSVVVRQGDAPTGADAGLLWFEDGRLFFAGRRTSFGLVPPQARGVGRVRERVRGVRGSVDLTLRRDTPAGAVSLSLEPILPPHESPFVARAALRDDLTQWAEGRSDGEGQWPPLALGPGVPDEASLVREALLLTAPVVVGTAASFGIVAPVLAPSATLLAAGIMLGAVPASGLRWRAWRDRRRLR